MISISYTPIKSSLIGNISQIISDELYELLSFKVEGYIYSNKFLDGSWDGTKRYYSKKTQTFPSGLLWKVIDYFNSKNIAYQLINYPSILRLEQSGNYTLREYQGNVVDTMFANLRGIIKSPPRSGKTMMASAFLDQSRRFPAVFLCNSIDIAQQTLQTFEKAIPNCKFGFIGDSEFSIGDITIVTVQSAISAYEIDYKMRRAKAREKKGKAYKKIGSDNLLTNEQRFELRDLFDNVKTVIYDECHHSQSSIAVFLFTKIRKAECVFGLSATPNYGTEDDLVIEATIGKMIYSIEYEYLISQGFLLPPKIYFYKVPKVNCSSTVFPTIYREAIIENEFRNILIAKIATKLNSMNKTVLIIVDKKTHGNNIHKYLPKAVKLYGEARSDQRMRVKTDLNNGVIKCVISTLWDEGADIPGLHYVINAAGGISPVDLYQRLRSITPDPKDPSKKFGGYIDFLHREKFLQRHSNYRKNIYTDEPCFEVIERDVSKLNIEKLEKYFKS